MGGAPASSTILLALSLLAAVHADATTNLLVDAGFEWLSGNEPNSTTSPWFTSGEGQDGSFVTDTDRAHGGSRSGKFTFYYDDGAFVQNLDVPLDASQDYEASVWMLTDEPSGNETHTNAPTLNITLYTSPTFGGTYTYRKGFVWSATNSVNGVWEQLSGALQGAELAAWHGEYPQIRLAKPNQFVSHRIWIDDASLAAMPPLDATVTVAVTNEEHRVSKMAMGTGLVYSWYPDSMFANGEVAHIIKDIGLGSLRWPGGAVVTFYHWDSLNGQGWMDHWNPSYDPARDQPPDNFMDLDEYLALIEETGAEIMLGVNMSSGIEWNRESDGLTEASNLMVHCQSQGHDVKYVYFDNENFQPGNNYNNDSDGDGEAWDAALYAQQFNLYAAVVKATFPDARLIANARNNVTSPAFLSDIRTMLSAAGSNIDFIDLHYYWQWDTASWPLWKSQRPMTRNGSQTYQATIESANALFAAEGYPQVRAAVLEWNTGPGPWMTDPGHNNFKTALMQTEMQMQFVEAGLDIGLLYTLDSPNVEPSEDKHVIHRGTPNATALWMWLFSKAAGKKVVGSSSPTTGIYVTALKGDDGELLVYLLNKTDADKVVELDLGSTAVGDISEAWRFHDGGRGEGALQTVALWEVAGSKRTTLTADSLSMIGFNYPAPVVPEPVAIDTHRVEPISDGILVGWHSTAGDPDVVAPGVSGFLSAGSLEGVDASAGSTDGSFGTTGGAPTALTAFAVRATNGSDQAVLSLVNHSGVPLRLDAVHFDYSSWWANSPRDVALVYGSGDLEGITNQTVIQSVAGLSNTGKFGNYPDFDWSLAGIADRVLEHGEEVHFSLRASNAGADWANGAFDNIAISGGTVSMAADSVVVSWRAHTGDIYTVMRATDLASNEWQAVSAPVMGRPGDMSEGVDLSLPGFYRLKIGD